MRRSFFKTFRKKASSLVVTLLVIVVLSTIVVAFMQSMSIERLTAKSLRNILRSELSAQAGLETALFQIQAATGTNQAYVVGQTNLTSFGPVLLIGQTNLTNFAQTMPLISGRIDLLTGYPAANSNSVVSYINAKTNTATTNSFNLNLKNTFIEATSDTNKYRAPWVYLTNSDGTTNSRYAYVVLDEWARVNPRYHGNTNLVRNNPTNWFTGIGALPLYTGGTNLFSVSEASSVRAIASNNAVTPHTLGQAFSSRSVYEAKKHLVTIDDTWSPDVIPADKPQRGLPKFNINDLATNTIHGATATLRADKIASIIATNLPDFGKRDLGLQNEDPSGLKYIKRLAASIVDYIDADSVTTLVNGGEPAGMEATPYLVMLAEKNTWVSESAGPPYTIVIRSEFYGQLWNPYSVPVSGNVKIEVQGRQYVDIRNGGSQTDFNDFNSPSVAVTLQPNEFKAVRFGTADQSFVNFLNQPSSASGNHPTWPATSSSGSSLTGHPHFRLYWNNNLVNMNRSQPENAAPAASGLGRNNPGNTFGGVGAIRWSYNCQPANSPNTVADPRITFLSETDWLSLGAANTGHTSGLWQGRQADGASQRSQDFRTTWAARDYIRANSTNQGITLSSANGDPTALTSQYNAADARTFIASIRNASMQSIGELGHLFDPIQVNDTGGNSYSAAQDYHRAGGGYSLRIGQPEFTFTSTNGRRAVELLDLFTVNSTNSASDGFPASQGRVNVNTAPQSVLEALFYNISPTSDAAFTNSVISAVNASNLANTIITNRPYDKLSDLHKITAALANATNFTPNLSVNVASNANAPAPFAGVFDRAREETFGKMIQLATVQSRSFRIYVVGEALNPVTGKREGRSALEAIVSIRKNSLGQLEPYITYTRWEN